MNKFVIKASYGNDSLALIQWAFERGLRGVTVVYSNTGWASRDWPARVAAAEAWVICLGYEPVQIASMGFEALVRKKKAFPRQGIQFCTEELKIVPSQKWLDENDPDKQCTILVGKRRVESANRASTAYVIRESVLDGGRRLIHPMFNYTDEMRDELLRRAGWDALPHRSKECYPCNNSNKSDIRLLSEDPERVAEVEAFETSMGFTQKGAPRTMFRPYRYRGATGIRQMIAWANTDRGGEFSTDDGTGGGSCYSGQCGI